MEVLVGLDEEFRSFYPLSNRSASGTPLFSSAERPTSINSESLTPYVSFPAHIAPNSSVTHGCNFGNSCYCCKVPQNALFPPSFFKQSANGRSEPVDNGDASRWFKEFTLYQGYSYPRIPACFDLPIVHRAGDHTHDTWWTMEDHQPWDWSNNCSSSQLYYSKHQTQSPHIWKPSLAGKDLSSALWITPRLSSLVRYKVTTFFGHIKEAKIMHKFFDRRIKRFSHLVFIDGGYHQFKTCFLFSFSFTVRFGLAAPNCQNHVSIKIIK